MLGMATLTIVLSSRIMKAPVSTTASASQRLCVATVSAG
jgi:hypothetical protein